MRLSARVVDCTFGVQGTDIEMQLRQQDGMEWRHIAHGRTGADGGLSEWRDLQFQSGTYRLEINIDAYYAALGIIPLYPAAIVEFRALDPTMDLNLTLLITANSFQSYRVTDTSIEPLPDSARCYCDTGKIFEHNAG